ncbi:MAG: YqeG family HAD IIIA-type phosphatase [Leptolyngbyaceae cyanobacterium bins.59]|nr:YqeG family HAD IIIA-type phosphatase [Leptolyngbyaceae cyanobacterium bins.59]
MSIGLLLQPDLVLDGPVLKLTPSILERHSLKGLILDVDETLVPFSSAEASAELLQWAVEIKQVATLHLVSNNLSEARIQRIAHALAVPYTFGARKPSRRKVRQAFVEMNLPMAQVAMVGDRLFTDVLAGNRLGLFTVLVEPMVDPDHLVRRHFVRTFEVWISQKLGASLKHPG